VTDRGRPFSPQTSRVLVALGEQPAEWRYGYELGLEVGLKSGSLYPILMRLSDIGLLESRWEQDPPAGRPPRHLYRLSATGLTAAAQAREAARPRTSAARRPRTAFGIEVAP
jgi:DNA-binding PadR family transcriptional regulator